MLWTILRVMFGLLREPRIVAGIALMVVATAVGGVFLQRASARVSVWQVDHALASGTVISSGDVHATEVAGDVGAYLLSTSAVLGRTINRPLQRGELLPSSVFASVHELYDEVMVPATSLHMPDNLVHGERVDVWVSTAEPAMTALVLRGARVLRTIAADVGGGRGVALAVPPKETAGVVAAMHRGDLDLVRVTA